MPAATSNSIGHYLSSRSGSSSLTSNLTFNKSTAKSSTFTSVSDTARSSTSESKGVKASVPVAKPRSVYTEPKQETTRSSPPRSYPLATKSNLDSLDSYPVVTVGNGGEDWGTKKRVETKTVKTIETRRQRQLVLEDGRIIEEDEPEVTVDTIEDVESHSDDGEEDRNIIGGFGGSYDQNRALQTISPTVNGNGQVNPWKPGGNVLGEDLKRNTYTTDVQKRSYSTTSATNVGEIKKSDISKIIKEGRNSKTFLRPYDDTDSSGTVNIAPKVTHKNSNRKRIVDREDIQEVHRMQDGVVKTDRYVNRECIEDQGDETPEEGDSTDTESNDGDKDSFSQRREDKFIDYYRVPKGKTVKEGKLVRHGIHLSSHDKNNAKGGVVDESTMRPAIAYRSDDQSDSTATPPRDIWSNTKKPPKPDRKDRRQSSARKNDSYRRNMRYSSSERERESTRSPNNEDFPPHYSTPTTGISSANKFHTIERSSHVGRSKQSTDHVFYGSSTIGTGTDQRKPVAHPSDHNNTARRGSRGRSSDHFSDDMASSYRSRSMSRSNQGTQSVGLESTNASKPKFGEGEKIRSNSHHRSMGTIRKDLDSERSGRLKRAMSFSTNDRRPSNKKKSPGDDNSTLNSSSPIENNRGLLGSMKSLYASLRRGSVQSQKKEKENRVNAANRAWFDDGTTPEPKAPPRKTRSQVSSMSGGGGSGPRNNRAYSHSSTNIPSAIRHNSKIHSSNTTGRLKTGANASKSFEATGQRQWDIHSSKPSRAKSPDKTPTKSSDVVDNSPTTQPAPIKRQSRQKSPLSFFTEKLGGGSKNQVSETNNNTADSNTIAESAATLARERQNRVDRRRTVSSYETNNANSNRDAPRFEEDRQRRQRGQVRTRFFGQRDEEDSESMDPEADELGRMHRPPPDMRRLLLNNINMTRSKSIGNDLDQKQPSVIRAI